MARITALSSTFQRILECVDIIDAILSLLGPSGLYLTDKTNFLLVRLNNMEVPGAKEGHPFNPAGTSAKVIAGGRIIEQELDKEKYGVALKTITMPVLENGMIIGSVGLAFPREIAQNLKLVTQNIDQSMTEVSGAITQLASSATEVNGNAENFLGILDQLITRFVEISEMSKAVARIATELKIIGFNAAIEAARAGESGRGFTVVADEIRKLADNTQQMIKSIDTSMKVVHAGIEDTKQVFTQIQNSTQEQAAAAQEISASVEEVSAMTQTLGDIANQV